MWLSAVNNDKEEKEQESKREGYTTIFSSLLRNVQ